MSNRGFNVFVQRFSVWTFFFFFGVVLIVNRDDLNAKHAAASTHILLLAVALNGSNDSLSRTHRTVAYAEPIEMLIHLFFNGHSTSSGGEFRLDHFPGK